MPLAIVSRSVPVLLETAHAPRNDAPMPAAQRPLLDLLTSPWAIVPDKLVEIQAAYTARVMGDQINLVELEARLGRPLANDQQQYSIRPGGVAVLPIEGVLAPKANLFTQISGGASAQMLQAQVESAIADPRVQSLVLLIDSPGGSVFGSPELAAAVREMAAIKPIVAVSDGMIASAAYWIGSAANAVYITGPTVHAGSIGVVATHSYTPRRDGGATTEITAGRYKRMASDTGPLTAEGQAYIQDRVDHLYSVFVDAVAVNRGVDTATVLQDMADGRVFVGSQAIEAGLVDGMASLNSIVDQLAADPSRFAQRRGAASSQPARPATAGQPQRTAPARAAAPITTTTPEQPMPLTLEQILAEAPDHAAALREQGAASERARIQDVRAQSLPGHDALIERLAFDGTTTGPQAAVAVLAAERTLARDRAQAMVDDTPAPLPADATADAGGNTAAAAPPATTPMQDAKALAARIATKQAEAAAAGRPLSAIDALALIRQE